MATKYTVCICVWLWNGHLKPRAPFNLHSTWQWASSLPAFKDIARMATAVQYHSHSFSQRNWRIFTFYMYCSVLTDPSFKAKMIEIHGASIWAFRMIKVTKIPSCSGQYRGRLLKFSTRSFQVLGISYLIGFVLYLPIISVNFYGAFIPNAWCENNEDGVKNA